MPEPAPGISVDAPDPWPKVALLVALVMGVVVFLLVKFPTSVWTWVLGIAVVVFAVVMYLNPRHWLKRRSATCLGIAGTCVAIPAVTAQLDLPDAFVAVSTGASPLLAMGFGFLSAIFAWLDRAPVLPISSSQAVVTAGPTGNTRVISIGDHATVHIQDTPSRPAQPHAESVPIEKPMQAANLPAAVLVPVIEIVAKYAEEKGVYAERARSLQKEQKNEARHGERSYIFPASNDDLLPLSVELDIQITSIDPGESDITRNHWYELSCKIVKVACRLGDMEKARARLESILELFPEDRDSINRLGNIHLLQGRIAEAQRLYSHLLAQFGTSEGES